MAVTELDEALAETKSRSFVKSGSNQELTSHSQSRLED